MLPAIKKLVEKIKQINKEYIFLGLIVSFCLFLIYSSVAVPQASEQITIATYYPSPFGEFNVVEAGMFRDWDDPGMGFLDPNGNSQFQNLTVLQGITADYITGPSSTYFVDFNTGDARFNYVYAERFYQGENGPGGANAIRGTGKHVWDIAEGINASGCQAGDVVLISDTQDNTLVKSSIEFDTRVAGVVSEDPKMYMGPGEDKVPLALAGIVKCNVSAENGRINRGDLLVTSSTPGHAMKASGKEVKPGMLVGKALEPLKEKTGKIFILVNKQ
jgi:hypothetical protein